MTVFVLFLSLLFGLNQFSFSSLIAKLASFSVQIIHCILYQCITCSRVKGIIKGSLTHTAYDSCNAEFLVSYCS